MDRRADEESRDRIDEVHESVQEEMDRIGRVLRITEWALIGLILFQLVLGGLNIYLVGQNSQRARDIQAERRRAILTDCLTINRRYNNTVHQLRIELLRSISHAHIPAGVTDPQLDDLTIAALARLPLARARQIIESQNSSILLIRDLAPPQHCGARVERLVGG